MRNRLFYVAVSCLAFGIGWPASLSAQDDAEKAPAKPSYFEVLCGGEGQHRIWKLEERWTDGIKDAFQPCESDDLLTFWSDKHMGFANGPLVCSENYPDAKGTWGYHDEMGFIVFRLHGRILRNKVMEISQDKIIIESNIEGQTFLQVMVPATK